jgi:acyl carrier protein
VTANDITTVVRSILGGIAPEVDLDQVRPGADLRDELDIDSMDFLRFVVQLKERLGVDVPEAKVAVVIGGQASTRQATQRLGRVLRKSGNSRATLYEVVCEDTKEVERSRKRRQGDAYERTVHRRV